MKRLEEAESALDAVRKALPTVKRYESGALVGVQFGFAWLAAERFLGPGTQIIAKNLNDWLLETERIAALIARPGKVKP